jgi:hypothetical protein
MGPPHINYINHNSILVINTTGEIRQLFVPFQVQVTIDILVLKKKSMLLVEEVQSHYKYHLIYRILGRWYPFTYFRITVID